MAQLTRWDRPRGAVHNVASALEYGKTGCNVLVLSDAALYVVQNFLALDIEFKARWADVVTDYGFLPIDEQSENYADWLDMIGRIQAEGVPMTCDLVGALDAIKEQMESCCTLSAQILARLMTGIETDVSGEYLETHPYYDPPSGYVEPPVDDEAHCARCWSFVTNWREANIEARHQASELGQIGVGLVSIIFAALALPFTVVLLIIASIVEVALEMDETAYNAALNNASSDIACALYTASNSATAVTAARAVIDNIGTLNARTKEMLKAQITFGVLDSIYNETYAIRDGMPTDCSSCEGAECSQVDIDEFGDNTLPAWTEDVHGSNIASAEVADQYLTVSCNSGGNGTTNAFGIQLELATPWLVPVDGWVGFYRKTSAITSQFVQVAFADNPGVFTSVVGNANLAESAVWVEHAASISAHAGREITHVRWALSKATGPYVGCFEWVRLYCANPQ